MSDVIDIAEMTKKGAKAAGQYIGWIDAPIDDGKPKSCWLKSHYRGFGSIPFVDEEDHTRKCNPGRELSGGLCYDICPQGSGSGPLCWGTCPA